MILHILHQYIAFNIDNKSYDKCPDKESTYIFLSQEIFLWSNVLYIISIIVKVDNKNYILPLSCTISLLAMVWNRLCNNASRMASIIMTFRSIRLG